MPTITVGMADLQVSADPDGVLVTYGLGSCIAVLAYDPVRRAGGMLHYMLPNSTMTPERAREKPAMFADTGVPLLFERLYALSCKKSLLVVKVVGGANINDVNGTFDIGNRNYVVLRKMFSKVGVTISAEDVGGSDSRTARLFIGSGRATVRKADSTREIEL
jgi:chemotaxis protein CheD